MTTHDHSQSERAVYNNREHGQRVVRNQKRRRSIGTPAGEYPIGLNAGMPTLQHGVGVRDYECEQVRARGGLQCARVVSRLEPN